MDVIILFVLKSIIVSGILFTWYILALKNKRLHNYNRFFLLSTLYASIQVPLLHFKWSPVYEKPPVIFRSSQALLTTFNNTDVIPQTTQHLSATAINWPAVVSLIIALISAYLLAVMLIRILWILRIAKQYPHTVAHGITLVHTDLHKAPFSFMNRIFWREGILPDTESGSIIMRHELAHVRQKHTYDKLACQLLTCIFWFNPFYWLLQKELCMVHEFIADEQAISKSEHGIRESDYTEAFAKMMLQVHYSADYLTPEHQFFSSSIKRRLTMLQTNKTVRASLLRRVAVLPLMAGSIFIFAFSPRVAQESPALKASKKIILVVDAGHGGSDEGGRSGSLVEKDLTLKIAQRIMELAPRYNIQVHLTRNDDNQMTLEERVAFSNSLHPDGFISIHVDNQEGPATGKGTFDIAINDKNAKAEDSKELAYAVYKRVSRPDWEQKGTPSEKSAFVLRATTSAAALLEIGDIKNKEQMQHIQDDEKLDALCSRILEGVVDAHTK